MSIVARLGGRVLPDPLLPLGISGRRHATGVDGRSARCHAVRRRRVECAPRAEPKLRGKDLQSLKWRAWAKALLAVADLHRTVGAPAAPQPTLQTPPQLALAAAPTVGAGTGQVAIVPCVRADTPGEPRPASTQFAYDIFAAALQPFRFSVRGITLAFNISLCALVAFCILRFDLVLRIASAPLRIMPWIATRVFQRFVLQLALEFDYITGGIFELTEWLQQPAPSGGEPAGGTSPPMHAESGMLGVGAATILAFLLRFGGPVGGAHAPQGAAAPGAHGR